MSQPILTDRNYTDSQLDMIRKLVPETHHWHMKHKINIHIPWKITDIIYERYSRQSVAKITMAKETAGIIIRGIVANIQWDLYDDTHKNKIA